MEERQSSTPLSSDEPSAGGSDTTEEDTIGAMFIRHKLTKLDTLAGLAVRYKVTVSDIKRANGLLADSSMFARDTLLIPTRPLPVGPEYSTWAGMIVTHFGRLGVGGGEVGAASVSPYSLQFAGQATSLQQLRGYYSSGPSRTQSPQRLPGEDDGDQQHLLPWSRRSGSERGGVGAWAAATAGPQTVELMERSGSGGGAAGPGMALSAGERLRRRTRGESQQQEEDGGGGGGSSDGFVLLHRAALFGGGGGTGGGSGGGGLSAAAGELASAGGRQLQRWQQALACRLSGLKRVASQPKMAPPATGSLFGGVQQQLGGQGAAAVRPSPAASGAATVAPGSRKDD